MDSKQFEEHLEQCLQLVRDGMSIDECLTRYPEDADELRAHLVAAQALLGSSPAIEVDAATQQRAQARLLGAVAEAGAARADDGLLLGWPFRLAGAGIRRAVLLPYALPIALALLLAFGGLTTVAAVLQPDVPVLRGIFGGDDTAPPADSDSSDEEVFAAATATETEPATEAAPDDDDAEPRTEFDGNECELRGPVTSLDPLIVNGTVIDASTAAEVRGEIGMGTFVRVRGRTALVADERICVAEELRVEDLPAPAQPVPDPEPEDEPRTEFDDGECELRGAVTSVDPITVNGVAVDASQAERIRGAVAVGVSARIEGVLVTQQGVRVCLAERIEVDD